MKSRFHLVLLLASILWMGGCTRAESDGGVGRLTDGLGRYVEVELPVTRAVTIAPSATEIAFAAGAGPAIVGVTISDNYPPEVLSLPRHNSYPVDLEAIVALNPQLVLASDQVNHTDQVEPLERLGIPSYFLSSSGLADVPDLVREIGRLFGTEQRANVVADSLAERLEALKARTDEVRDRPDVLILAGANPLYAFGSESYVHEMITAAGGTSTTASIETATPILSDEYVLRALPDVIVGTDSSTFSRAALLESHPTWDIVPAVRDDRIIIVDPDLIYRPGPRLIEGAYQIARALHPNLFDERP